MRLLLTSGGVTNASIHAALVRLLDTVWVGVSAGSTVMTPWIGTYFVE